MTPELLQVLMQNNQPKQTLGQSKTIDDILNAANIAEFLSEAMSDKTNVDASSKEVKQLLPGRRDVDEMMRALFPDAYLEMQRSQLEKKLRDLDTKPLKM